MYYVVARIKGGYLASILKDPGKAQRLKDSLDREGIPATLGEAEDINSADSRLQEALLGIEN